MKRIVEGGKATAVAADAAAAEAAKSAAITSGGAAPTGDGTSPSTPDEGDNKEDEDSESDEAQSTQLGKAGDEIQVFRFVKYINTFEVIKLTDGTEFQFQRAEFNTTDAELAKKLLEVAGRYSIFQ